MKQHQRMFMLSNIMWDITLNPESPYATINCGVFGVSRGALDVMDLPPTFYLNFLFMFYSTFI